MENSGKRLIPMPMSAEDFQSKLYSKNQNMELLGLINNPNFKQLKLLKRIIHKQIVNFVNF